jgi:hypothetical protein
MFTPYLEKLKLNEIDFDKLSEAVKKAEGGELKNKLSSKLQEIRLLKELVSGNLENEKEELNNILGLLEELERLMKESLGQNYYQLLIAARNMYEQDNWEKTECPLCNQQKIYEDGTLLYETVIQSINDYQQIEKLRCDSKELWESFTGKKRLLDIEQSNEEFVYFTNINKDFDLGRITLSAFCKSVTLIDSYNDYILTRIKEIEREIKTIEEKLPPSLVKVVKLVENARNTMTNLKKYDIAERSRKEKMAKFNDRKAWVNFITRISGELSSAESILSTTICNEIETEACTYFKTIMGNQSITLSLKRSTTSQDLGLELPEFYSKRGIIALPVLSESYRNALAISIFLAAALRQKTYARFIIFDDITSSFDAGCQFMLMELLKNSISTAGNNQGLQIIILSHDGLLKKYFDRQESSGEKWQHIKLQGLPPNGSVYAESQGAGRLKAVALQHLNRGNCESAFPLIRQYLEFKLTEIIDKLNIPVPLDFAIRDDRKMVSNSINAINSAIKLHAKANDLILSE